MCSCSYMDSQDGCLQTRLFAGGVSDYAYLSCASFYSITFIASRKTIITCDSDSMSVNIIKLLVDIRVGQKGHAGCKNSEPCLLCVL